MDNDLNTGSVIQTNDPNTRGLALTSVSDNVVKASTKSFSLNGGSSGETDDSGKGTSSTTSTGSPDTETEDVKMSSAVSVTDLPDAVDIGSMQMEVVRVPPVDEETRSSSNSSQEEVPCHSGSLMLSQKLETPGSSGSSGIKKRTTTSQSRNYRHSNLMTDPESSNDVDAFTRSKTRPQRRNSKDSDSDDDECELPFKFMKGDSREPAESSTEEMASAHAGTDVSSSSHRSTPTSDFDYHDFNDGGADGGDSDDTPEHSSLSPESISRARRLLSSSSSSSSSFLVENSESSSSSSDNYLEDLDERLSEAAFVGPREEENNSPSAEGSSSLSSTSSKQRPGKKIPRKILELPKVLLKPKPKHSWNAPTELLRREIGLRGRLQPQSAEIFRSKFYGCLFSAERLELMKKLDGHHGCVNCLNFNYSGTKLASGSDDLYIKIWDYAVGKCITSFQSGHKANVFQAKFVPLNGLDTVIVSCARDNQVRLSELNSSGKVCSSRKLAQHRGPAHKLSISPDSPHVVLSCGEDGVVFNIDIREDKPERLVKVFEKDKKVALFSIHQNPLSPHEFCVTGKDQYVRIYDTRKLRTPSVPVNGSSGESSSSDGASSSGTGMSRSDNTPLKKFCPHHLTDSRTKTNVTAAVYNYNGQEILASYNDENIYLFDSTHSDGADCIKVYEGHRNNATVKGVNFFGDRSQFVVSGSDCGNIYIWDKETESIVNFFRGDENGVVNCLEGHPTAPILATSGLDDDVKIWIPSNEKPPKMSDLATTVRKNLRSREDDLKNSDMDGHIMWALWSHLRQADRDRRRAAGDASDSNESFWRDEEDDDDDDEALDFASRGVECSIS